MHDETKDKYVFIIARVCPSSLALAELNDGYNKF